MAINDVNTPGLWVAGFTFVVLVVAALFGDVTLLDVRTLGVDESLPTTVAVVETMLALWWFDNG